MRHSSRAMRLCGAWLVGVVGAEKHLLLQQAFVVSAPSHQAPTRGRGVVKASAIPGEPPNPRDWTSKRRRTPGGSTPGQPPRTPGQSRLNKPQKDETKKETSFSKDHFYTGKIGIGTHAWGDSRRGFFYGDYPTNAMERSQLSCGAFNENDIEEAFTLLEGNGLPMFDARELYPCEELLGEMVSRWKKRQLKLQNDVKQIRPFIATSYQARLFGRNLVDVRGGKRALMKALEKSLEHLQATRVDLYQVTRPSTLYWGGEKALFEAIATAKRLKLIDHVGVIGYNAEQVAAGKERASGFGLDLKSNSFEFSLANPAALRDGTIEACRKLGMVPFANRPLAGGLASGVYTMMDPNGGKSRRPRYEFPDLEPLYPVHKALKEMANKYSEKLGQRTSTAQVSINWVRAKGAVPLVGVKTGEHAKDVLEATKWDMDAEDAQELESVAMDTFRKRSRIKEAIKRARAP